MLFKVPEIRTILHLFTRSEALGDGVMLFSSRSARTPLP